MDWNAFSHPGVLLTVIGVLVSIVVWFVRLEGKVNEGGQDFDTLHDELKELRTVVNTHRENAEIHFNLRLHQEIERRQDDRFKRVEGRLGHIEEKVDQLLNR